MATRIGKACVVPASAILLAAVLAGGQPAHAGSWQKTAGGTYSWIDGTAWDTAFPNAPGAVANINGNLAGNQTINLNQAITIGTLNAGDLSGSPASTITIGSGAGGNPLTFQSATPGGATALNVNMSTQPSPLATAVLNLTSGLKLGGTSPLTATVNSPLPLWCSASTLDLNGNTFTLGGIPRETDGAGTVTAGASWTFNTITGGGNYVQNGAGTTLNSDSTGFAGTLTINNGPFTALAKMSAVTQYAVGGAFEWVDGATGTGKYPIGGTFTLGNGYPLVSTLPDRLNHNGTLVFNSGGFMTYVGAALDSSLSGQAVLEQVRQIKFSPGMSELRILNSTGSSSTTLLANDATNACVRAQGATFMVGGDDNASQGGTYWLAMGVVEKLKFASGMSQYMIGGGGAAGTQHVSIIPWMTGGTIYHPMAAKMMTYDPTNGVRCLVASEYYTGAVYGAPADANVSDSDLGLGAGHAQTINAYSSMTWNNVNDIGTGSTLTVTSGLVQLHGSGGSIGNDSNLANAGTLNFGSAEGIIFTAWQGYSPNTVGSIIAGSGGLTTAGTNILILKNANTYTGKTTVGAGILQIGDGSLTISRLGNGDVEVVPGARLRIKANVANGIADTATVSLDNDANAFFGTLELENGINEKIAGLLLSGIAQPAGTYGSSSSSATYKNDSYFVGSGILTVTAVPEPASLALLGFAGLLLRRRRI